MIQTVDFFTPVVDDPYTFGQIAAANSLSDVYACGGEPKLALNVVGFPNCLDPDILSDILRGGADKVLEAGAVLAGGHSVQDDEPKYGLCVSGFVHPDKIWRNGGSRPGDALILTKQIGSGVITTAGKADMASEESLAEAVRVMSSLNKKAKEVMENYPITACTDITGFGLLGHGTEMALAGGVTLRLHVGKIPWMKEAVSYAQMGLIPAGSYKNREYRKELIEEGQTEEHFLDLMYDPQTSGGLLFSVAEQYVPQIMKEFETVHLETRAAVIGEVVEKEEKCIRLTE